MTRDIFALMGVLVIGTTAPLVASDRSLNIQDFTNVSVRGGVEVDILSGDSFHIEVDVSRRSLARNLTVRKRGDTLVIERERGWSLFMLGMADRYHVTVTMPELAGINAGAGSDVDVRATYADTLEISASSGAYVDLAAVIAQDVALRASSGANVEVAGTCTHVSARASSGANIDAEELRCQTASARASSGADIDLYASETAEGRASSGGDIDIHGPARLLDVSESSGGDVSTRG